MQRCIEQICKKGWRADKKVKYAVVKIKNS